MTNQSESGRPSDPSRTAAGSAGGIVDSADTALIAAHVRARKRYTWMRGLYPLVLLGTVVGYLALIASDVNAIDPDRLGSQIQAKSSGLEPIIEERLAALGEELAPVYENELDVQMARIEPKATRMIEEHMTKLIDEAPLVFERDVTKMLESHEAKQRAVLAEHVPSLKGDVKAQDRVLEGLRGSILAWCIAQLNTTLHGHLLAMEDIRNTMKRDYAKFTNGPSPPPEEAFELWLEVTHETLGGDSKLMDKPKAAEGKPGEGKPGEGKPGEGKPGEVAKDPGGELKAQKYEGAFRTSSGLPVDK
jgi:hypothetical protein